MRSQAEVAEVLELADAGLGASSIARRTGLPRGTVKDWMAGRVPRTPVERAEVQCKRCGGPEHHPTGLPDSYPYVLGMYLGDGCISLHARGVARIRICLDLRYPGIIEECEVALAELLPRNRVHRQLRGSNYTGRNEPTNVIVSAYSKALLCHFPQHGPGRKHERPIALEDWQREHIKRHPGLMLRGLIHSDGCRFINTGTNWRHPRYCFRNLSADINHIFVATCSLLGVHCTHAPNTVYVSRKADVAILDQHVGPKG